MSTAADGWWFPNQNKNIRQQFADGVRAFMLDIHEQDGALVLRHGPPLARFLGWRPLKNDLCAIRELLEANPRVVVTIILESYARAGDVAQAFRDAGLERYAFAKSGTGPWPRVEEMIRSGKRLVIFTDRPQGGPEWQMDVWAHAWETPFEARGPTGLRNVPNRGKPHNALLILNHFCADPFPSRRLAAEVNAAPFLGGRLADARKVLGRDPNYLVVDFYDLGDAAAAVSAMNWGRSAGEE